MTTNGPTTLFTTTLFTKLCQTATDWAPGVRGSRLFKKVSRTLRRAYGNVGREGGERKKPRAKARALALDVFPNGNHYKLERELALHPPMTRSERSGETLPIFDRFVPRFEDLPVSTECPPEDVAFFFVVNALYFRGLEAALLSLMEVYPGLRSPIFVCHDGDLSRFAQARLSSIYSRCVFHEGNLDWFEHQRDDTHNHRRIGKLGYLNTLALELRGYRHVVLLDSDVLILGDISELWQSETHIAAGYCFGARPYCGVSEKTGRGVINSGVISIPARFLNDESVASMRQIMESVHEPVCPLLDRFADQKAWNLFLAERPFRALPYNYNCNVKQLAQFHQGTLEGIRVLHYAGPKPWISSDYVTREEAQTPQIRALTYHTPWRSTYRTLLYKKRLAEYREQLKTTRSRPVLSAGALSDTCVLIGNGPSLKKTDLLPLDGIEKFCFNWFILHPQFDEVAPQHLILGSHFFFGGWNTLKPRLPHDFFDILRTKKHKPCLWTPFYFKTLLEEEGLLDEFECNFFLFEKPFKRFVEVAGYGRTNLDGFLYDGRTASISIAIPVAGHLGFRRIILVGCDCSYQQADADSDYFYEGAAHTTPTNSPQLLRSVWAPGGPGAFAYSVIERQLREQGRQLVDATIDGHLTVVPKLNYEDFLQEIAAAHDGS